MSASLVSLVTTAAGMSWLVSCAIKAALLLAASWLGAALLRRGTAAARHQLWTLGVVGALVLPLLCWVVPSLAPGASTTTLASTHSFAAPAMVVTAGPATSSAPTWPVWLAIAWALGALVVAVRLLRGHLAARRLLRAATPGTVASWTDAQREASGSLGIAAHIPLLRSDTIDSPMTIGVLRPCVLLPAAAEAWSPARLRAVLVHELGHVRRHDTVIQLAAQLGCALYWWNPLAWLAASRLRIEREHACDDLVLDAGILPSSYAADLLAVARSMANDARDAHARAGAICMVDLSWTEVRLRRILDATAPRRPLRARFRIAVRGLTLASAATLACTSSPPPTVASAPAPLGTLSVGAPYVRDPEVVPPPFVRDPATFGPPRRPGSLDLALVSAEVKRRLGDLERCYERRLAVDPALSGTVEIHWVIEETGEVAEACITKDTVGDAAITACVNQLVQDGGRFPAPRGGAVDVSFPFVFTARPAVVGALSAAGT